MNQIAIMESKIEVLCKQVDAAEFIRGFIRKQEVIKKRENKRKEPAHA